MSSVLQHICSKLVACDGTNDQPPTPKRVRIRGIVWRDRGQMVVELRGLRACLAHAGSGGLRAATLAYAIRVAFNMFLALNKLRRLRKSHQRVLLIRHVIFGEDSFRFAALFGTFVGLYKLIINALPIVFPSRSPSTSPGSVYARKHTRRWHSALAGAVSGGLAILCESKSRRTVIAQQLFARGLQGSYNTMSDRYGFRVPHGAAIVFALSCGQIIFGFFLHPETLPRSYIQWIQSASRTSGDAFTINRTAVHEHAIDVAALDKLIAYPAMTPTNHASLLDLKERALAGAANIPHYMPCYGIHPMSDSCLRVAAVRFFEVAYWMLPIYSALHFVPTLVFRWQSFRADPLKILTRTSIGSLRSSAFLGAFVIICQGVICAKHNLFELLNAQKNLPVPKKILDLLISPGSWWFAGLCTGLSLLLEDERRRAELALYVLPKGLEGAWVFARGRGLVGHTGKWGDSVLASMGMGMVMTIYQNHPEHLSGLIRKILYQFVGPN